MPHHQPKIFSFTSLWKSALPPVDFPSTKFLSCSTKQHFSRYNPIKIAFFSCSHCSCSFFLLISYSLDTQVMLILIFDSQEAVLALKKVRIIKTASTQVPFKWWKKPLPSVKFSIRSTPCRSLENRDSWHSPFWSISYSPFQKSETMKSWHNWLMSNWSKLLNWNRS